MIPVDPKENNLGSLRRTLAEKIWRTDGSSGTDYEIVGKELIPFLEGIVVGNGSGEMGKDAKKLIEAINKYGKVRICIHG